MSEVNEQTLQSIFIDKSLSRQVYHAFNMQANTLHNYVSKYL